jgi:hypothetical protein
MHSPDEHFLVTLARQLPIWFGNQPKLSRKQLLARVATQNPTLKEATLDVYLHRLAQRNYLVHVGRGQYALPGTSVVVDFTPAVPPQLATLWQEVAAELFLDSGCVWTTQWLNDFTTHQLMRTVQVVEVAPEALHSTYYALKDRLGGRVFLQPDARVLELYVAETPDAVLVLPLVSRAPVQRVAGTPLPRLEKLLVDLLSDPTLFAAYQGEELRTIYRTAAHRYRLDARTLLSYAKRRGKAPALLELVQAIGLLSLLPT